MISSIVIIAFIYLLILVWKNPEYGIFSTLILTAFCPIFDSVLTSQIRLFGIFIIFVIELLKYERLPNPRNNIIHIMFVLILIKEGLALVLGASPQSFVLAVYVYIVILGIVYFNYRIMVEKQISFLNHYKIYILLCLCVQFYRAFLDFTFMGYVSLAHNEAQYADLYNYGGELYRPSSLQGCIVYAIELAVFIGFLVLKEGITKKNLFLLIISIIGLFLTFSRSGIAILAVVLFYYMIKSKQYIASVLLGGIFAGLLVVLNYSTKLSEALDFGSDAYYNRFNSISTVSRLINNFEISQAIFGLGYGSANYAGADGNFLYYVENFFLATFVNSGLITLSAFVYICIKAVINGTKTNKTSTILLICLLGVNLMACSLAAYTVQILFWLLFFSIIYPCPKILNEIKHENE